MNWERNPDAEVSDGWLSNIAARGGNLADRLEWEPEFCTRPHWLIPCPDCGRPLQDRQGRYGDFYACTGCDWKTSVKTKKAKAVNAAARITGWCGTRPVVRYSHLGVPYPGCPACASGYRHPTLSSRSSLCSYSWRHLGKFACSYCKLSIHLITFQHEHAN
jgi:hypothetical protein